MRACLAFVPTRPALILPSRASFAAAGTSDGRAASPCTFCRWRLLRRRRLALLQAAGTSDGRAGGVGRMQPRHSARGHRTSSDVAAHVWCHACTTTTPCAQLGTRRRSRRYMHCNVMHHHVVLHYASVHTSASVDNAPHHVVLHLVREADFLSAWMPFYFLYKSLFFTVVIYNYNRECRLSIRVEATLFLQMPYIEKADSSVCMEAFCFSTRAVP